MVYVVAVLVALACAFSVVDAYRRLGSFRQAAALSPRAIFTESREKSDTPAQDGGLAGLVVELAGETDARAFEAALNQLTLDVEHRFRRSETVKMNWRICAAATGGGIVLTVWDSRTVACLIAVMGVCAGAAAARWSSLAEHQRQKGRERWSQFIDWARVKQR